MVQPPRRQEGSQDYLVNILNSKFFDYERSEGRVPQRAKGANEGYERVSREDAYGDIRRKLKFY